MKYLVKKRTQDVFSTKSKTCGSKIGLSTLGNFNILSRHVHETFFYKVANLWVSDWIVRMRISKSYQNTYEGGPSLTKSLACGVEHVLMTI